tara:strand:+ start:80 stop:415 length:336 start_codon:yes stop_codon:yes gene_type:complete
MDIPELPEKQRRLKEYMIINPNGATIKEIMLASGFTEEEFLFSNNLIKEHPNTFWGLDYYHFENNRWINKSDSKNHIDEIRRLRFEIKNLTRENELLKAKLGYIGNSKENV